MSRFVRNTAILAKVEATYGTDATPTGAANALLVSNLSIDYKFNNVGRDLVRPFFGGSDQLAGTRNIEIGFEVELSGSGAAGTAPAWGPLLQACGMTETVSAGNRVEYLPNTDGSAAKSLSIYFHDDGLVHKVFGARGTVEAKMEMGGRPVLSCKFVGLDGGASAVSNPTLTLTAWKAPVIITDPNAADITLGCTYSAGALSGGTTYPSKGLTFNLGNEVKHIPLLGGESVDITSREATGKISLDLTAAQEATAITDVTANTTISLGFQFGMAAGYKVLIHAPVVQRTNPKKEELDGRRLIGYDLRFLPSAGNDELRIVAL